MNRLILVFLLLGSTVPLFATGQPETPWERSAPQPELPREIPEAAPDPSAPTPPPPPEPLYVSIIPGYAQEDYLLYWTALGAAMERAVAQHDSWRRRWVLQLELPAESHENAVDRQIVMVEEAINRNPHGIVIVPLDAAALAPHLARAQERGIPVLIPEVQHASGGTLAGDLVRSLHPNEPVVVVGIRQHPHREDRLHGVREALGSSADIAYPNAADTEEVYDFMWDLLSPPREATAVIALDYFAGRATVRALEDMGLAGTVTTIVFDPFPPILDYKDEGVIHGTVVDPLDRIGFSLVQQLLAPESGGNTSPESPVLVRRDEMYHREQELLLQRYTR
jgi:ribose transport system substrate-binding protein